MRRAGPKIHEGRPQKFGPWGKVPSLEFFGLAVRRQLARCRLKVIAERSAIVADRDRQLEFMLRELNQVLRQPLKKFARFVAKASTCSRIHRNRT